MKPWSACQRSERARDMTLWSRIAGSGPTVVIAEAGINHDGSVDDAHALIDLAASVGADAVKFQTFRIDSLVSPRAESARYQQATTGVNQQGLMLQPLVLPDSAWPELSEHALSQGLDFLSTPFDVESAELLSGLGMELAKVPSGELTNLGFLRDISAMFDKVLLSTGMATLDETEQAVRTTAQRSSVALMHCISCYPAPNDQLNLAAISTLRERFGLPVGWSDHSAGIESAALAVALGATVLEKHITLDRRRQGPDHAASADAETMSRLIAAVRSAELMLGDGVKRPQPCEADVTLVARRSWHASRDLPAGHTLSDSDLVALRPGFGISPNEQLVGRRLEVAVAAGTMLEHEMLNG